MQNHFLSAIVSKLLDGVELTLKPSRDGWAFWGSVNIAPSYFPEFERISKHYGDRAHYALLERHGYPKEKFGFSFQMMPNFVNDTPAYTNGNQPIESLHIRFSFPKNDRRLRFLNEDRQVEFVQSTFRWCMYQTLLSWCDVLENPAGVRESMQSYAHRTGADAFPPQHWLSQWLENWEKRRIADTTEKRRQAKDQAQHRATINL